jgi:hypothetical protein
MNKPSNDSQNSSAASNNELSELHEICKKTLASFSAAWVAGDVDKLVSLMSDDPIYKGSTGPNPGTSYSGRENIHAAFKRMVPSNVSADKKGKVSEPPQMYFFDDYRALVFWRLTFPNPEGDTSEVDGIDIMTFTNDGRIAVKDAYRKAFS